MKYIFLGASVTGMKFIERMRSQDQDAEFVVVSVDDELPALPERFCEVITRQARRADAVYQNENFYRNLRVEFISDKKVQRVNFQRKAVFFDDKTNVEGDAIIIASPDKDAFPDIRGTAKEGVFSLRTLEQVDKLLNVINRIDTIAVQSETLQGMLFSLALAQHEKEVIFCLPSGKIWADVCDDTVSDFFVSLIEQAGIRVIRNGRIDEVLGENDVKAVRLNISKVVAAEIVVFPDALPDMRLYAKTNLECTDRIQVDAQLRTNISGVWAIDDMAQGFSREAQLCDPQALREHQVAQLMAAVHDNEAPAAWDGQERIMHVEIAGRHCSIFGNLKTEGAEVFAKRLDNGFLEKYVSVKNGIVRGALVVDNPSIAEGLWQLFRDANTVDDTNALLADCAREGRPADTSQLLENQEVTEKSGGDGQQPVTDLGVTSAEDIPQTT